MDELLSAFEDDPLALVEEVKKLNMSTTLSR